MSFVRRSYPVSTCSVCKKQSVFDPCRICAMEAKSMSDEEMAELTERLSGVPAASVLRALAVEYEDGSVSSEDVHREATE